MMYEAATHEHATEKQPHQAHDNTVRSHELATHFNRSSQSINICPGDPTGGQQTASGIQHTLNTQTA